MFQLSGTGSEMPFLIAAFREEMEFDSIPGNVPLIHVAHECQG
jgi:hypothetical protein